MQLARRVIEAWAIVGGIVLLAVVLLTVTSVVGDAVLGAPLPGDFELVEVGVAVAAFAFLPYCQLTGANVSADIFTSRAPPHWVARFSLVGALIASAFSALLLWRMSAGLGDYIKYEETTAIWQFPLWLAFVPILVSLALLLIASAITVRDAHSATRSDASSVL